MNKNRENVLIGIMTFLLYFVQSLYQDVPLKLLGIDYNSLGLNERIVYLLSYELVFILILIYMIC